MLFHSLLSSFSATCLLLWRKEGFRFPEIAVISEHIYIQRWFEETNCSQRDILKQRPQEEESILLTFRSALFKKSKFSVFWHLTWQLTNEFPSHPSKVWFLDFESSMNVFQLTKARTLLFFFLNYYLIPWPWTDFSCPRSSWSIRVQLLSAVGSSFSWCFS